MHLKSEETRNKLMVELNSDVKITNCESIIIINIPGWTILNIHHMEKLFQIQALVISYI